MEADQNLKSIESGQTFNLLDRALANRELFTKLLFERPDSFAKLLPYQEYLSDSQIFILKDGSLGAIFDVDLIQHETLEAQEIVDLVDGMKNWFMLPENYTLQVLFDQANIPARDPVWENLPSEFANGHSVSMAIHQSRMSLFKDYCEGKSKYSPMRRRTLLSIRYFPEKRKSRTFAQGISNVMNRGEKLLFNEMSDGNQEILEFKQTLEQFTESSKVKLTQVSGEELVAFLRRFFNPKEYLEREFSPFNSRVPISDQIVFAGPRGSHVGIEREGIKTRTISLKTSPHRVFPGGMANFLSLNFPFRLSLNFSFPTRAKTKSYFDFKEFFLQNSPSARAKRQQSELKQIQERLAHDERCLYMTFCVVIEGETEEILNYRARAIASVFHNDLECEVIKEELIGFGLCLNSLPLFYSPAADHASQRYIRIMNKDATKLLPVFDSYQGMKSSMQHFLSRENNLVPFSWCHNEISNHMAILGDTGSGKSKFALDCVQAIKRRSPEPLVFVIDKRASCKALCRDFGGELLVFDPNDEMPFSAFRGNFDDAKVQFLTQLILTAVKLTSESFEMESQHLSVVSKAVKEAFLRRARERGVIYKEGDLQSIDASNEVQVSMDDVIASMSSLTALDEFETMKDQIDDLISRLMPFYKDGIYAPFFKTPELKKSESVQSLYAYDLEALDADQTLKVLMSMCVIQEILGLMAKPENMKRGGVLYIEELGCLGRDNPIVGQFVREAAERMRKMGFWLMGVAPNPRVFFETEAGRAVWEGAEHFCFLKMSPDNIKYLKENSELLKPADFEILNTLETISNEYAEVYYTDKAGKSKGAFRYIQSDIDRRTSVNSLKDEKYISENTGGNL